MKPKLEKFDHWACVTVKAVEIQEYYEYDEYGTTAECTGLCYVLQCDCGKRWTCPVNAWKGKRAIQDCGCGKASTKDRKEALTLFMPATMADKARMTAQARGISLSQWVRDQIQRGIDGRK